MSFVYRSIKQRDLDRDRAMFLSFCAAQADAKGRTEYIEQIDDLIDA